MSCKKEKVVVAFATDHNYRYYTGVTLHSLIEHSSADTQYVILILSEALSETDQALFTRLVENRPNFTLRFIDPRQRIEEYGAENASIGAYKLPTLYRLFIHELLPEYDKILYLDSDILVRADVKELFEQSITPYPIGAVKDQWKELPFFDFHRLATCFYVQNELQIEKIENYFNAGVTLMDLAQLRSSPFSRQLLEELNSGINFQMADQDILNRIFSNKVHYLEKSWNFVIDVAKKVESPKIIHFAGIQPWNSRSVKHAEIWWQAAEKTFFIEELKRELPTSPGRIKYLEKIEKAYYDTRESSSWRITAGLRFLSDVVKCVKLLLRMWCGGKKV